MNKKEFNKFFKSYSKNVDNANKQYFWKLSDDIIIRIIKRHIPIPSHRGKTILDAGGGTGRWILILSKYYKTNFILYDLSRDMLRKAKENISQLDLKKRVKIIRGNLTNMKSIKNSSIDYIISIYNPISFIENKKMAIKELYRILKKNGQILIMGQGYFNALYSKITNYNALPQELDNLEKNHKVKWAQYTPELNVFSKETLEKLLKSQGFNIIKSYGIPILVQPGVEDFDPENILKSKVSKALENKQFYKKVLEIEMKYNSQPSLVNRGVNILTVAKK